MFLHFSSLLDLSYFYFNILSYLNQVYLFVFVRLFSTNEKVLSE